MKIRVDKDEWYPVYTPYDEGSWIAEVSDDFIVRYRQALDAFNAIQDEIHSTLEEYK